MISSLQYGRQQLWLRRQTGLLCFAIAGLHQWPNFPLHIRRSCVWQITSTWSERSGRQRPRCVLRLFTSVLGAVHLWLGHRMVLPEQACKTARNCLSLTKQVHEKMTSLHIHVCCHSCWWRVTSAASVAAACSATFSSPNVPSGFDHD